MILEKEIEKDVVEYSFSPRPGTLPMNDGEGESDPSESSSSSADSPPGNLSTMDVSGAASDSLELLSSKFSPCPKDPKAI